MRLSPLHPLYCCTDEPGQYRRPYYEPECTRIVVLCKQYISLICERLKEKGKVPKVVVVAVMKKLLHIAFGILKHNQPFAPRKIDFA